MRLLIEKIEAEKSPIGSIGELLKETARTIDADHAEVSLWQFSGAGDRLLARRFVFDPHALNLALVALPADERPQMRENVHTWAAEEAVPGRGGPALLSARTCDDRHVILIAFRRWARRKSFTSRHALLINALNHCHEFSRAVEAYTLAA